MFHIVFFLFVIDMRGCILIWLVLFKSIFATIYKTKLYAQGSDNDESYENKFITGSFEGPTLYFFLGANELAITFTYDDILKSAWVSYQNVNYYLHVDSLGAFIANTDDIASFESQFFVNSSNLKRANLGSFYYYTKLANEGSSNTSSTQYPFLLTDKWNPDKSYRFFQLYCQLQDKDAVNVISSMSYTGTSTELTTHPPASITTSTTKTDTTLEITTPSETPPPKKSSTSNLPLLALIAIPFIALGVILLIRRRARRDPQDSIFHSDHGQKNMILQDLLTPSKAPPAYIP